MFWVDKSINPLYRVTYDNVVMFNLHLVFATNHRIKKYNIYYAPGPKCVLDEYRLQYIIISSSFADTTQLPVHNISLAISLKIRLSVFPLSLQSVFTSLYVIYSLSVSLIHVSL